MVTAPKWNNTYIGASELSVGIDMINQRDVCSVLYSIELEPSWIFNKLREVTNVTGGLHQPRECHKVVVRSQPLPS